MIKYVIIISTLTCLSHSQRPSYAGSPSRGPLVLPQYTTPGMPTLNVANRIDSLNADTSTTRPASTPVTVSTVPQDLPIEASGDINYLNMIKTWPREKQPFWYINQQQINAHRGVPNVAGTATQAPQTLSRSFFTG